MPIRWPKILHKVFGVTGTSKGKPSRSVQCCDSPPRLSVNLPKPSDVPRSSKISSDVELPIHALLLTDDDCGFRSCILYLDEPFKRYFDEIGYVYFGSMGDGEERLKIALIKCPKVFSGTLPYVNDAIAVLRPKAVFSVGACTGLNSKKTKLGDVVVSSKLTTHAFSTPVSSHIDNIIRDIVYGWKAPVENLSEELEVRVHRGEILSVSQEAGFGWQHEDFQHYPEAIAVETEGEIVFAVAHDNKIPWMVVKGISGYGDTSSSPNDEEWKLFASVMAASVVANVLADPFVFQSWPHHNPSTSSHSSLVSKKCNRTDWGQFTTRTESQTGNSLQDLMSEHYNSINTLA